MSLLLSSRRACSSPPARFVPLLLVALLSTACASPAGRWPSWADAPPEAQAAQAAQAAPASPLALWWQDWNDAPLHALIEQALQASPTVRQAQAALRQARAQVQVQTANLAPGVDASASAQRNRANHQSSNRFQVGLDASWEWDVWGRLDAGIEASQADAQASQASLAQTQVTLAAEVALQYISLRSLQARWEIAQRNLASQRETWQLTDWRVQAGLSTSLVLEQARASMEQTAAQIPQLHSSLAQARHRLAVLTGQAPTALEALLADARPVPQPAADLAVALPAETLRQRPDVRAAEERIRAALARVAQADAARYPSFRLGGSIGLSALTLGTLGTGAAVANALLASVSVPLLDGGAARAQVQVQAAALEQARSAYQATVLTALQEVADALVALQGDRQRLTHLQAAAQAAENAALLAQQRYRSGLIDFQAVLETQRTLLSTQDSVASTAASVAADHVRLYKALGGGWIPA
ncbi:MAG: efflux transporter outer membrane subunit [Giesbergeria sp.]|uniref:efflux transporter outer membrane subunit n=1 Tax=Giesbergeria sp. TaxID=2818473 RepID=UPI0026052DCA|nr:efflux transporter outer membrane subunit [Giesbergeria sp.]MDD2610556.1 efflux transporter outer membrane subunit [Giesbergeria sp.]